MISLVAASENPWWESYSFSVDSAGLVIYYQKAHDSYQWIDSLVPKEKVGEIVQKLKQSRQSLVTT